MTEYFYNFIFITLISIQYVKTQFPEMPCANNKDCEDVGGSKCVEKLCKCEIDEVVNSDLTACLPLSVGYGSECKDSLQCSYWMLTGSECNIRESKCVCKEGYHYRNGRCYKTTGLLETCKRNEQCYDGYDIEALQCKAGICVCSDNYFSRFDLDCRRISKNIGDPCLIDVECQFENAICAEDFSCQLAGEDRPHIFTALETNLTELTEVVNDPILGAECKADSDCKSVDNAYCLGHCRCKKTYRMDIEHDRCQPELNIKSDAENCKSIRNSDYRDGKCLCRVGFAYAKDMGECIKATRVIYTHSCTMDVNCHTFGPGAICNQEKKTCECGENSWYHNETMICRIPKGIGENCFNDDDCYLDPEISKVSPKCVDKICVCPEDSYAVGKKLCQEENVELGESCTKNSDCRAKNSECIKNICRCNKNYFQNEKVCDAGIGSKCSSDDDCLVHDSYCNKTGEVCECEKNYVNSNHFCYRVKAYLETCEIDIQCEETLNYEYSACVGSLCKCTDGHHYRNKKCWPKKFLGEVCTRDGECYIESDPSRVECRNSECLCIPGWKSDIKGLDCEPSYGSTFDVSMTSVLFLSVITIFKMF